MRGAGRQACVQGATWHSARYFCVTAPFNYGRQAERLIRMWCPSLYLIEQWATSNNQQPGSRFPGRGLASGTLFWRRTASVYDQDAWPRRSDSKDAKILQEGLWQLAAAVRRSNMHYVSEVVEP